MESVALPLLSIDDQQLTFLFDLTQGREKEAFSTLLTFTTFMVKKDEVILEAYENLNIRLNEEGWYKKAKEYHDEYFLHINNNSYLDNLALFDWLDTNFFNVYKGYEEVKLYLSKHFQKQNQKFQFS